MCSQHSSVHLINKGKVSARMMNSYCDFVHGNMLTFPLLIIRNYFCCLCVWWGGGGRGVLMEVCVGRWKGGMLGG